ncbi:hypothetical protein GCM10017559_52850 [Streptosporangium longisporum]|uniref:Uncharacterized protein n=1 Tax=Streptosporangium longisporum TaxID=46187 RepID=A0ABP6KV54_9ACTN
MVVARLIKPGASLPRGPVLCREPPVTESEAFNGPSTAPRRVGPARLDSPTVGDPMLSPAVLGG